MPGVTEAVRARLSLRQWTQTRFNPDTGQLQTLTCPAPNPGARTPALVPGGCGALGTRTCRGQSPWARRGAGHAARCASEVCTWAWGLSSLVLGWTLIPKVERKAELQEWRRKAVLTEGPSAGRKSEENKDISESPAGVAHRLSADL